MKKNNIILAILFMILSLGILAWSCTGTTPTNKNERKPTNDEPKSSGQKK